jgi:hypothetical protein
VVYITHDFATMGTQTVFAKLNKFVLYNDLLVSRLLYDKSFIIFVNNIGFPMKQRLLSTKSVFLCSHCKIHRYVIVPSVNIMAYLFPNTRIQTIFCKYKQ